MSRLLRVRCIQDVSRLKKDVTSPAKPVTLHYEDLFSKTRNCSYDRNCVKKFNGISSLTRKWQQNAGQITEPLSGYRMKYNTNLMQHMGQINCVSGSVLGIIPHNSSFQTVSTACFHTTRHLNSRVADFFKRHRQGFQNAPLPALALGLSGLIPFVVPAVYTVVTFSVSLNILWAQVAYGASILSFLGGIRWGYALTDGQGIGPTWSMLGYSIMPSLIAWLGLLMPLQPSQLCVMTGLLMAWVADIKMKAYPAWFRSLRHVLSLVALLSLGISYGFSLILEPTSEKHGSNLMKLIKIVQIILEE